MQNFIGLFGNQDGVQEPHTAVPTQNKQSFEMRKISQNNMNQQDGKYQVKCKSPKFASSGNH